MRFLSVVKYSTIKFFLISFLLIVSGCGDNANTILTQKITEADSRLDTLKNALDGNQIRNAVILREYAQILTSEKPDLNRLITSLSSEASSEGRQYQLLANRMNDVKKLRRQFGNPNELIPEVEGIIKASDPAVFNDALVDPINVIADMSEGKLPRIGVLPKDEEKKFNSVNDYGAGSQLVGNPAYGYWNQSGGTSFWEWYGMYAMFSSLMGGNRVYHNDWNRGRPYSYYQDYGMDYYGSNRYRNKYGSTYQKSSSPGSSRPTTSKTYSGTKKGSSYSKGSGITKKASTRTKKSGYSGTLRKSSYSSRSFRGGK